MLLVSYKPTIGAAGAGVTPEALRGSHSRTWGLPELSQPEIKGQAGACPDRTRAIPCKVQASRAKRKSPCN